MSGGVIAIIVIVTFIMLILISGGCYAGYREYLVHHHNGHTHLHRVRATSSSGGTLTGSGAIPFVMDAESHTHLREHKREEPGQALSRRFVPK